MTEDEILDIERDIEEHNNELEKAAQAKFNKGSVPKMKWVMEQTLECLLVRIALVKSGKAPDEFGSYMSDELARILATKTFLEYEGLSFDENAAKEADSSTSFEDVSNDCTITAWTPEFGLWRKIVTALGEYLYAAAILAKSVNASSTAARLFLRAWRIVKRIDGRGYGYAYAFKDEALSIVRLGRVAADRLWVDAQFTALPPFRKAKKKSPSRKAKGRKKAN